MNTQPAEMKKMNDSVAKRNLPQTNSLRRVKNCLTVFDGTALKNLKSIELMSRYDTKYIFHIDKLPYIFENLKQYYEILEIANRRSFKYESMYYDTDDYFFYHQHHNERPNRYKIRCRRYLDSGGCFFEVKYKNNKEKTIKNRYQLKDKNFRRGLSDESKNFAINHIHKNEQPVISKISPKLRVDYNRITLVNQQQKERLTIDINLTYIGKDLNTYRMNNLIIAELKQGCFSPDSPSVRCFRDLKIFPTNFSKYCIGIAITENNVKKNRFKKKLLTLEKFA